MNGFISPKALRFTLVASACLLSGFVSGNHFHGLNVDAFFSKQELNYSKISWISQAIEAQSVQFATVDYPASDLQNSEIKLADFHLPKPASSSRILASKSPRGTKSFTSHRNLEKLGEVIAKLNQIAVQKPAEKSFDVYADYRMASEKMAQKFILTMNRPIASPESVVIASSSASASIPVPAKLEQPVNAAAAVSIVMEEKIEKPTKVASLRHQVKHTNLNTQKVSIQIAPESLTATKDDDFKAGRIGIPPPVQLETGFERKDFANVPVKVKTSHPSSAATDSYSMKEDAQKTEDEVLKSKMQDALMEQHIEKYTQSKTIVKPVQYATVAQKKPQAVTPINPENEIDHTQDVQNISSSTASFAAAASDCKILPKLHLIKPSHGESSEDIQVCPTHKQWLSKSWGEEGWAKVETEDHFSTITYYPQINSNKTLLLDQNAVALLAIRSGVHYTKGTGIVLGTLPTGFKVEFSGRGEEVQYFDLNAKKYFVILNVEPGAGVTELVSEKNQNENATVFTPVLGDAVTYLDFAAPISVNIPVKVSKGDEKTSSDLAGLTIGLSTQTQVQAITQANGTALLKGVRMVPGYPVFVDVSSKLNGEKSYQYRYQLNKRTKNGVFILKQYPEKQIYQWFKQIKTGLSDQSGYVFGEFNRKRLDGFRKHYSVKVESITEKFGLTAKNYTVLWDEKLSDSDPLEGDRPRFLSVQIPEGLTQAHLTNENGEIIQTSLIPVSPRVINVVSE